MHGDNYLTLNVNTLALAKETRKRIRDNVTLLRGNAPPDLVLNPHCGHCEFQNRCLAQAREKDDLSLLNGMSEKDRKKLHGKGIFTVTQLSYTFRPRRRRRELRGKQEKYHHSLRALAIRENKIHAVGIPALKLGGTRVFMDIEGIPDRDLYYLIGLRVETAEGAVQHSLWADTAKDENLIWSDFLSVLSEIRNPQLIHYGSYETIFLRRMCDRHGRPPEGSQTSTAIDHPINILSFVYAQVYFPTHSNGLKEITGYLGFPWSGSPSSGQQNFVITSEMKRESIYNFKTNQFVLPDLHVINKAAYWDYQRERVYVKSSRKSFRTRKRVAVIRGTSTPNATIEHTQRSSCPKCKSEQIYKHCKLSRNVVGSSLKGVGKSEFGGGLAIAQGGSGLA